MVLPPNHVEALTVALLAVNRWTPERVYGLLPALRAAGLTNPSSVAQMDVAAITRSLDGAGYARGRLTGMFAQRLEHLMRAVTAGSLDALPVAVSRQDWASAKALICAIPGAAPVVAQTTWKL